MRNLLLIGLLCFSAACTVGPNYRRPALPAPETFRAPDPLPPGQADSFADLKWFEVFKDEQLQALIRRALSGTTTCATPWPEWRQRAPRSASRGPISFLNSGPARP
jgi:outer membrane protein TolC